MTLLTFENVPSHISPALSRRGQPKMNSQPGANNQQPRLSPLCFEEFLLGLLPYYDFLALGSLAGTMCPA